ncbi:MAG: HI0074 family nucleotidyltransferase substrate-binding subunit [Myxococcaceae bacterium]
MNTRKQEFLESLTHAIASLGEGLQFVPDSSRMAIDATIQRFEFSFELLWKTVKLFLADEGIEANSPRSCFEEAYKRKWMNDEQTWLHMMKCRNLASHTYDEKTADEIYEDIRDFLKPMKDLCEKLTTSRV